MAKWLLSATKNPDKFLGDVVNINTLIDGSNYREGKKRSMSNARPKVRPYAITIHDLVKQLNGSGLMLAQNS